MKNREKIYQITAILLLVDQFIKYLITHKMNLYDSFSVIPGFFSIFYVRNSGAAFSILEKQSFFLIIVNIVVIVLIDRFLRKEKNLNKTYIIPIGMILGGIFGNLLDRIIHHEVIDYLSFYLKKYSFPVFNFADMMITIGIVYLIIVMLKEDRQKKVKK